MKLSKVIKDLIILSIPIVIGQLGQMLISVGDVYMAGKLHTNSVAAIGVAIGLTNPLFLFGIGLLVGIAPKLSINKGKGESIEKYLLDTIVYSVLSSIIVVVVSLVLLQFLEQINIKTEILPLTRDYIEIIIWSFPFAFIFQGIKEFLQAQERVIFANTVSILSVLINLLFNYILIFGKYGFPALGHDGLAWASFSIRFFMAFVMILYVFREVKFTAINFEIIVDLFKFSLPIAILYFLEVFAFCLVSILVGTIGVIDAAANNIILNIAALSFMVPLSLGQAASVKIGYFYGEKNFSNLFRFSVVSGSFTLLYSLISITLFTLFPAQILLLFTKDTAVIELGVALFGIVCLFQFSDCMQIYLTSVLRGIDQNKVTSYAALVSHWMIGIPTGLYLCYSKEMGSYGLWIGLACGLTSLFLILITITIKNMISLSKNTEFNSSPA